MTNTTPDMFAEKVKQICQQQRVVRLRLFGSTVSGNDRPDSDVDILVEYEADHAPTFFNLAKLEEELSPFFNGRTVDLIRPGDLHWFIRRSILNSARTLYER